jgi:lactaldehyde dehydrogenase/glycolaldehyde dehydrogenase
MIEGKMLTGGSWTDGVGGKRIDVINPATEEVIGSVPDGVPEDAENALDRARKSQPAWEALPPIERAMIVRRLCALLDRDREPIARLITMEQGKPISQARGEVSGAIMFMDYAADSARRLEGEIVPSDIPGEEIWIRRNAVGVVVGLTAWNFPIALAGRKLGPALVAGNTIVLKSHELTPLSIVHFGRLCQEAGLPDGVVNIVSGTGRGVGEALVRSARSDLVTLTGSVRAGHEIYAAGAETFKLLRLELGGKAPYIVMEDADLDRAVDALVGARFTNCGQVCTCAERAYLHEAIHDRFLEKFLARVCALKIGDPFGDVDLGPKVSRPEADKVASLLGRALATGATLLNPAEALREPPSARGYWVRPAILSVTSSEVEIMREEIFGPVLPVMRVRSYEEAFEHANRSSYGLSAYLFTRDLRRIMHFSRHSAFGELYINRGAGEAAQGFHSGFKQSGLGGEDGKHGLEAYLRKRTVYVAC